MDDERRGNQRGRFTWLAIGTALATLSAVLAFAVPVGAQEIEPTPAEPVEEPSQILFVVSNSEGNPFDPTPGTGLIGLLNNMNRSELQLASVLSDGSTEITVIDDGDVEAEDLLGMDLVVITAATSSSAFQPFMLKAAVPIISLKPANWNALGLSLPNVDFTTPLQQTQSIDVDTSHPIAQFLDPAASTIDLFTFRSFTVGRGWAAGENPVGDEFADVVAMGPDGAALMAFEPGDALGWAYLDPSDTAIACRVAFPSNGSSEATYTADGVSLFVGAVEWALRGECQAGASAIGPSLGASMCRTEPADEDRFIQGGEFLERSDADEPNLSSLWVRAIEHTMLDGEPVAFIGGRFQQAFDARTRNDDVAAGGFDRSGVFGCNLTNGTVTAFDVPILLDPFEPAGDAVANERIRALAFDGTWLYVGGKFRLDPAVFPDEVPVEDQDTPVNLIRVDPRTGDIDPTWTPNIRGSVSALALNGDWLYAGGGVRLADGVEANRLIRIDVSAGSTGATDAQWRPNVEATIGLGNDDPFATVLALDVIGGNLVAGGAFQLVDGEPRNSLASFNLATGALTDFAPSLGDNNFGTDPIPQIKDVAELADGSILACGDWWLVSPTPGLTWTAYDHDGGVADPNVDPANWFGQRSKVQPRPNQFNSGKFDPVTGAAVMVDGLPWGPVTDGGIQACDVDPVSNLVIFGGHYESAGTYVDGFVPEDSNDYPDTHVAFEKVTAVDGATGEIIAWDPDVDSIRGLDAVAIIPGASPGTPEIIIGGALTTADRVEREGLARFVIG